MATATLTETQTDVGEARFLLNHISWDQYEKLLELFGDDGPRMNYSRGSVELMSPLIPHERFASLIGYMVEALTDELDIRRNALGSTSFRHRLSDKGLEPDKCYYLANAGRIGDQRTVDLDVDPPPDLVIEIEITRALLDKLAIYAGLKVPEIWKFDGHALTVLLLQPDGTYARSETSASFPFLPMKDFTRRLLDHDPVEETRWARSFRAWVREVLLPDYPNPARAE